MLSAAKPDAPRELFKIALPDPGSAMRFDESPDGQRFLVLSPPEKLADPAPPAPPDPLTVVLNWQAK